MPNAFLGKTSVLYILGMLKIARWAKPLQPKIDHLHNYLTLSSWNSIKSKKWKWMKKDEVIFPSFWMPRIL
jgi:hypothetical protein